MTEDGGQGTESFHSLLFSVLSPLVQSSVLPPFSHMGRVS